MFRKYFFFALWITKANSLMKEEGSVARDSMDNCQLSVTDRAALPHIKGEAAVCLLAGYKQIGAFPASFGAPVGCRLLKM